MSRDPQLTCSDHEVVVVQCGSVCKVQLRPICIFWSTHTFSVTVIFILVTLLQLRCSCSINTTTVNSPQSLLLQSSNLTWCHNRKVTTSSGVGRGEQQLRNGSLRTRLKQGHARMNNLSIFSKKLQILIIWGPQLAWIYHTGNQSKCLGDPDLKRAPGRKIYSFRSDSTEIDTLAWCW